jgi:hypothetical protein
MRTASARKDGLVVSELPPLGLPQHPDEHRLARPVLLAVDQEFGGRRGAALPTAFTGRLGQSTTPANRTNTKDTATTRMYTSRTAARNPVFRTLLMSSAMSLSIISENVRSGSSPFCSSSSRSSSMDCLPSSASATRRGPPGGSDPHRSRSAVRPMPWADGRRIVRGVSGDRGPTPGFPDPLREDLLPWPGPAVLPSDLSQQDMFHIRRERSRDDKPQHGHKRPSLWKRLLGRRGHVTH